MRRVILNRLLYVLIGVFMGSSLVYLGCGDSNTPLVISAKNIVFRKNKRDIVSQNKAGGNNGLLNRVLSPFAYAQEEYPDETLLVFAEDVLLDTYDNSLMSENLQDALDNEMAIDIPAALSGRTWRVENRSGDERFNNTSGVITFTGSSRFTMDSGALAVPGMFAESTDRTEPSGIVMPYATSVDVEFLSNNLLWVTWRADGFVNPVGELESWNYSAIVQVIPVTREKFIFVGNNAMVISQGVSTLTLVE